jgi:DNA repair protein RecO (recombination protein O)
MPVHKTRGIVLRTVKYGETSLIVDLFTELFGRQSYLVNGVRTSSRKGMGKANLFQPAANLELEAYHQELKNLQRLKEFRWATLYQHLYFDVLKNSVALFMVELLQKTLKQPEPNPILFQFVESSFNRLDLAEVAVVANFPLYFALHLAGSLGLRIDNNYSISNRILDLGEGFFVEEPPSHHQYLDNSLSEATSFLLQIKNTDELRAIRLNKQMRKNLLEAYEHFFALHFQDFGKLRTLPVLQELFS